MRRILVPTDFSEQARNAFEVAVAVARRTGAAIKLLHVIEAPSYNYAPTFSATGDIIAPYNNNMEQVYVLQLMETTRGQMEQLINTVEHKGVDVVQEVDVDKVINKIKRTIREDDVDLVVMGSKGASGLDEFLVGSNTEKVVRSAECPVLTVKRREPNFDVREIVLASDFRREVSQAMDRFKAFQSLFDARLHLVYINTPGAFESSSNVRQKLEETTEKYGLRNYSINVYNDSVEEEGIMHFANDIGADLIMMATHGRTGFSHLLSGSIAEDLVNHTQIPVLTFHIK
ncbi:nucleotide-binding universal stress UspA family protein [Pontibacter ummariensis]|uniref:Nucleotide-binding universal stress protein, UspA family n=1 Tax=Pontibacter ummariensis TaxID=1610492 RepID=A0A239KRX4_9BACT|nr:universal stress protein [Pontibacter ummariensis]PRY05385.1 nucleotide-binding universal stress UspA family protein [Pontibacter ummariensis]SNT20279.1 Nucleotide-binding universal stress protein, UspA family [Pontibacter ummariensis]